jgi:phosphate transport system permease protein
MKKTLVMQEGLSLKRIVRLGEPFIWLSGAATVLTLFMIAMLLAVVLFEGLTFMWPRPVLKLALKDGSLLAGVQRATETYEDKDAEGRVKALVPRLQLMTANRDLSGKDFVWTDLSQVASREEPKDVLYLERREWGPLIAWPLSLKLKGEVLAAGDPSFGRRLAGGLEEARARFKRMRRLERDEVGEANYRMEALRLKRKRPGSPQAEIDAELAVLQGQFEKARDAGAALAAEDAAYSAVFRSVDGAEKELPLSQIVRLYAPNATGLFGKAGIYLSRLREFIFDEPRESNTEGGVFPAIFGTVMMTLIMALLVVPLGVMTALYLREYAKQGFWVSAVRIAVNNLAGVPSIVFGVFGLGFFVYFLGGGIDRLFFPEALPAPTYGTGGILWASLTLALLTVPVVVVATEEALAFVPKGIRDGSLACGATKWQTILHVVLPSAAPGILTGVILSMARGAGEVAPLMITGVVKLAPNLPFDGHFPFMHFDRKFMHLGFHIYDVGFQSPNVEAAMPMVYTTTLLLICVVVGLNLAAMLLRHYLRNRYRTSGF